jgi:hypothetical protein
MLRYITILPLIMTGFVYFTHRPSSIYLKCKKIRRKWTRLKLLVSSAETDMSQIYWVSLKMVFQLLQVELLKYFNPDSVKKIGKNTYEVSYELNNRPYKMLVTPYRGPQPVMQVIDADDRDITDNVLPYMGPKYDWHGHPIAPSFFNTQRLTINWSSGETQNLDEVGDE